MNIEQGITNLELKNFIILKTFCSIYVIRYSLKLLFLKPENRYICLNLIPTLKPLL